MEEALLGPEEVLILNTTGLLLLIGIILTVIVIGIFLIIAGIIILKYNFPIILMGTESHNGYC